MKRNVIALCVVTTLVTSTTGCGCFRRLRDTICRGARCGAPAAVAAPAPVVQPIAVAPMAYDPGCGYAAADPGCAYPGGQVVGYPGTLGGVDSGWTPGCESCSGGYAMPPVINGGDYIMDPNAGAGLSDPGPQ
ncbi:hypothetical protein [Botrimarina sp.]|uniref:hypothetical protein n=1 Tax=Botrimarina sp. TaxID=2795802 RepID=UPI0032EE8BF1